MAYTRWLTNQSELDQIHIYNVTTSADTSVAFKDESANDSDAFSLQDSDWMGFSSTRSSGSGGYDLYIGNLQTGAFSNLSYANTSLEDLGGHYTPTVNPPSTRTIEVDSTPQGVGFTISGAGASTFMYTGTTPWTNDQMLPGNYAVEWDPLPSYFTPDSETKYLVSGSISFAGNYPQGSDINLNGKVNAEDFSTVSIQWTGNFCVAPNWCSGADIDHSGSVDIIDLLIMAEHWVEVLF